MYLDLNTQLCKLQQVNKGNPSCPIRGLASLFGPLPFAALYILGTSVVSCLSTHDENYAMHILILSTEQDKVYHLPPILYYAAILELFLVP